MIYIYIYIFMFHNHVKVLYQKKEKKFQLTHAKTEMAEKRYPISPTL